MSTPTGDSLDRAAALVRAGERAAALDLLADICQAEPDNVRAWWLVAQALRDPADIRRVLQRVLRLDPYHSEAARRLHELAQPAATIPAPNRRGDLSLDDLAATHSIVDLVGDDGELLTPLPVPEPPPAKKKKRAARPWAWVTGGLVVLFGLGLLLLVFPLHSERSPATPEIAPDPVGPYYADVISEARYISYCDGCIAFSDHDDGTRPCGDYWTITGRVEEQGAGAIVRAWTGGGYSTSVLTRNKAGDYHFLIERADLGASGALPDGSTRLYLRLYDAGGTPLSGITDVGFDDTHCTAYVVFQREPLVGLLGSRPAQVRPWGGPYRLSYSAPTNAAFLTGSDPALDAYRAGDWTGLVGIAYDDSGPVTELTVQAWELGNSSMIHTVQTGDHPAVGGGGWVLPLAWGKQYVINVINPNWGSEGTQVIDFPVGDCGTRLLRAVITYNGALN